MNPLRDRYLDLLIGALTHTLYAGVDRLEQPLEAFPSEDADRVREELQGPNDPHKFFDRERNRAEGRDWPLYAQTMIGLGRIRNVRACVETVIDERIPGDLIETGVWRGGAAILMKGVLAAYGDERREVWLADSFRGLPPPDEERYPADHGSWAHSAEELAVPADEVRENFRRYGLLDDRVHLVEGWFRDTLPALRDRTWSLTRLDGDMYESTMDGLVNLYDRLSPGGFLIVDDLALWACRKAVGDFRRERGIDEPIEEIDWTGGFWRKAR